jgi:E3 ubiquitin-protein ligase HUWE1
LSVPVTRTPPMGQGEQSSLGSSTIPSRVSSGGGTSASAYVLARPRDKELARGILPATEAMSCVPQAFGAICLNAAGLELFQASGALESYFEIFESHEHVKCMKDDANLVRSLGTTFDELVRHHPALKQSVMTAVIVMVARVGLLCKSKAWEHGAGARLWLEDRTGKLSISGGQASLLADLGMPIEESSQSFRIFGVPELADATLPNGGRLVVGDLSHLNLTENGTLEPKDEDRYGLTVANYLYPVLRFLGAFFENQPNCTSFIEAGGVEFVLDFATLPSLPFNFRATDANHELTQLIHMLVETKPHLVLPSLLDRAQTAVDSISKFWREPKPTGFFAPLTISEASTASEDQEDDLTKLSRLNGTFFVKHLVAVHILTDVLREVYTPPMYQARPSQQTSPFNQVILADRYSSLITSLGQLHAACVWEEILLQKNIPERWNEATKVRDYDIANEALGLFNAEERSNPAENEEGNALQGDSGVGVDSLGDQKPTTPREVENRAAFKNARTLRYLLSSLPSTVTGFFHLLGHGLIGKRRVDPYSRQNASLVAGSIANAVLRQLQLNAPNTSSCVKDRFSYLIVILSSFSQLLFESESLLYIFE